MEKRKYQRAKFNVNAYLEFNDFNYMVRVANVSLKGMLLEILDNIDLEINSMVKIILKMTEHSSTSEISLCGTVTRKEGCFIGLGIDSIDLDSFINLINIVAYNSGNYDMIMEEFYKSVQVLKLF